MPNLSAMRECREVVEAQYLWCLGCREITEHRQRGKLRGHGNKWTRPYRFTCKTCGRDRRAAVLEHLHGPHSPHD